MNAAIFAIGTSIPSYALTQMEIAERLTEIMQLNDEEAWLLKKIYSNSAVSKRYSVLPNILDLHDSPFLSKNFVGLSERNAHYKREAPQLAEKAARQAISNWKGNLADITHVISVSCTGIITPGIEFLLAQHLALDPHVSLLGINFMGCFGAIKAIKVASKIAKENPKNCILLVCTELCSLHYKQRTDIEMMVIQSLFADGAAALIMGTEPKGGEQVLFEITDEKSSFIKDSINEMSWDASTEGFDMTLSARVPKLICEHIEPFIKSFLGHLYKADDYLWAIHPGGKAIVEAVEESLQLDRSLTTSSWNVLKAYGNLSSATFLYVLDDICKTYPGPKKTIGIGFGPGLCIESLLLNKV